MGMASGQPLPDTQKQALRFIANAAKQIGFEQEEVRSLLREKFGGYVSADEGKYLDYLRKTKHDMEEQERREQEEIERALSDANAGIHFPKHCPYHPEVETRGDIHWGKTGFACRVGGSRCYHRWRVSEIARKHGQTIDFASLDTKIAIAGSVDAFVYNKLEAEYEAWRLEHETEKANDVAGN